MKKIYKNLTINKISAIILFVLVSALFGSQIEWREFQSRFDTAQEVTEQVVKTEEGERLSFKENKNTKRVTFTRKVDGDTAVFSLDDKEIKCRFLSVDTPETVKPNTKIQPYGKQASDYTEMRLAQANTIYIEYDDESDHEDKYGRTLAWVWVDGSLLQEDLIRFGYAKTAYLYGDYKYNDYLLRLEKESKTNQIGLWGRN